MIHARLMSSTHGIVSLVRSICILERYQRTGVSFTTAKRRSLLRASRRRGCHAAARIAAVVVSQKQSSMLSMSMASINSSIAFSNEGYSRVSLFSLLTSSYLLHRSELSRRSDTQTSLRGSAAVRPAHAIKPTVNDATGL